jgi:hypothetical protein
VTVEAAEGDLLRSRLLAGDVSPSNEISAWRYLVLQLFARSRGWLVSWGSVGKPDATGAGRRQMPFGNLRRGSNHGWTGDVDRVPVGSPGLDKFHVHIRCFAAWEFQRNQAEETR